MNQRYLTRIFTESIACSIGILVFCEIGTVAFYKIIGTPLDIPMIAIFMIAWIQMMILGYGLRHVETSTEEASA